MKLNGINTQPRPKGPDGSSDPQPVSHPPSLLARIGHALVASVVASLVVQLISRLIGVSLMPELVGTLVFVAALLSRKKQRA